MPISWIMAKARKHDKAVAGALVSIPALLGITGVVGWVFGGWSILTFGGGIAGFFGDKLGINRMIGAKVKKATVALGAAASKDAAWSQEKLQTHVKNIFTAYQADWSSFNLQRMQTYLTPEYFAHMQLVLTALHAMGRQNIVENPVLSKAEFIDIHDDADNQKDSFDVFVSAQANDKLIDLKDNNRVIFSDASPWYETWNFRRSGNTWLLAGITQATESVDARTQSLMQFAAGNNYFYNADFGWLLLPTRGQLFSEAQFDRSDVNNHVIGLFRNVLVEFYSYSPSTDGVQTYVIAQAVLPKTYGNIVVRRKKSRWSRKIKGLNAISMEAREFNDIYEVFASDVEQVTSFELLHPAFMVKLIQLQYEVNIEVVDNVLYLYATDMNLSYISMQQILKDAFDELKL